MTDQLAKIAQIIQSSAFNGHRIRLIGNTNTAAIELRGLSDADMAELAGEPAPKAKKRAKDETRFAFVDKKASAK